MHLDSICLVVFVQCWLFVYLGWGDRFSTPQVQRLLLHERWLLRRRKDWHLSLPPHNVEVYSGGGGICPPPHTVGLYLRGRRTGLLPHNDGDYFGGGGTGPPPHNVGKFQRGAVATQMGRSGDTMIYEKATLLHMCASWNRSGRYVIPCGGVRGRSWSISDWVSDGRDASAISSVWVGGDPEDELDTSCW